MQLKTRVQWAGAATLLVAGAIGGKPLLGQASPRPVVQPAGVVAGSVVGQPPIKPARTEIRAISKVVVGTDQTKDVSVVKCDANGHVTHVYDVRITADMRPFECDECPSNPEWNVKFVASARVTRREDPQENHRGCFEGKWQFVNAAGVVLASGTWHGTVECGTHGGLPELVCEPCAVPQHFEGCLEGQAPRKGLPGGPARSAPP